MMSAVAAYLRSGVDLDASYPGVRQAGARNALVTISLLQIFNLADRYVASGSKTLIIEEFGLSDFQSSWAFSGLMLSFSLSSMFWGVFFDKWKIDRRKVVQISAITWCLATSLAGVSPTYEGVLVLRLIVGLAESAYVLTGHVMLLDFYTKDERHFALAFLYSASPIGASIGVGIGAALSALLGWRWAFIIFGIPGLLISINVMRLNNVVLGINDDGINAGVQKGDIGSQMLCDRDGASSSKVQDEAILTSSDAINVTQVLKGNNMKASISKSFIDLELDTNPNFSLKNKIDACAVTSLATATTATTGTILPSEILVDPEVATLPETVTPSIYTSTVDVPMDTFDNAPTIDVDVSTTDDLETNLSAVANTSAASPPLRPRFRSTTGSTSYPTSTQKLSLRDFKEIFTNPTIIVCSTCFSLVTFAVSGFSDWIVTFMVRYHGLTLQQGGIISCISLLFTGFFGPVLGAKTVTYFKSRVKNAFFFVSGLYFMLAGVCFYIGLSSLHLYMFILAVTLAQILVWTCMAPVGAVMYQCISPRLRACASAYTIMVSHLCGSIWGAPFIGAVSDRTGSLRIGLLLGVVLAAFLCSLVFMLGFLFLPSDPMSATGTSLKVVPCGIEEKGIEKRGAGGGDSYSYEKEKEKELISYSELEKGDSEEKDEEVVGNTADTNKYNYNISHINCSSNSDSSNSNSKYNNNNNNNNDNNDNNDNSTNKSNNNSISSLTSSSLAKSIAATSLWSLLFDKEPLEIVNGVVTRTR